MARLSGPPSGSSELCLRACLRAEAHVPIRPVDYIYSFIPYVLGLALDSSYLCESLAHPLGYFSSEFTTSSEKIPQVDSRPLFREDHQEHLTEKNGSFVSLPLLIVDHMYLFVFGDLALV